jgi:hypothetical protein
MVGLFLDGSSQLMKSQLQLICFNLWDVQYLSCITFLSLLLCGFSGGLYISNDKIFDWNYRSCPWSAARVTDNP